MRKLSQLILPVVAAALVSTRPAIADPPKKIATVEGVTEYRLDNGLRVLLFPDKSQPKVTVNMTVLVGSRNEGYGETGMAHLLEHMLFKGTPRHGNVPKALQEHGAQFNGSTDDDRTNYYETVPADGDNLEFAIDLESDRMVNSYVRREDLDSEMTVVRNEFERGENSPSGVLSERVAAAAYDWHNYGKSTIGNRTDIERVPIENLRAFYRKFYQPDNVVLTVAGQFAEDKALELVQKYFGAIPRPARKLDATYTEEPAQDGERTVTLRRVGDGSAIEFAYHIPAAAHEDAAPLDVLAHILSTQPSGRLYKTLVETKKAASVRAGARGQHDPGLLTISAEVPEVATLDEVRDTIISVVEGIGATGVTDEEVNRAKQQLLKARERGSRDTAALGVRFSEWVAQGDWRLYFLERDRLEQVTPAAVQAVAARYLKRNNRTIGEFIPTEKPERIAVPATPDIAALVADYKGREAAAEGEAFDPTPANIEARVKRLEIPEGIKVTLLPKKTKGGEVQVNLTLHYGNEENLKGLETAAGFLSQLMERGTKKLPYQELRDELERLDATMGGGFGGGRGGGRRGGGGGGGGGGMGSISFALQAKKEHLAEALEIYRQVLREPALPKDQFEQMKRQRLAGIERGRTEPTVLAGQTLSRTFAPYSPDNIRYIPTTDESIERLNAVTYEQVVQVYNEYLGSQDGELTIVGDFDPDICLPILKNILTGWKASKPYARIAMSVPADLTASEHKINTPDKANATYVAGIMFPLRDDAPDYPAVVMANYIFGGGSLSSRLANRVRQKEGLSYSVGSTLGVSALDERASLNISAICNPQNIDKLVKAVHEELDGLVHDGVTPEELDQARQGYLKAQMVRRTTDGALAGTLAEFRRVGRTMEFEADLEKKISALTADQVSAAAKKYFEPGKLVTVIAGDFDAEPAPAPEKKILQP